MPTIVYHLLLEIVLRYMPSTEVEYYLSPLSSHPRCVDDPAYIDPFILQQTLCVGGRGRLPPIHPANSASPESHSSQAYFYKLRCRNPPPKRCHGR